jgi:hypothetical protein
MEIARVFKKPWVQRFGKVVGVVILVLDGIRTLTEAPDTLRKAVATLPAAGHLLWIFLKWPIELVFVMVLFGGGVRLLFLACLLPFRVLMGYERFWGAFNREEIFKVLDQVTEVAIVLSPVVALTLAYTYGVDRTLNLLWYMLHH